MPFVLFFSFFPFFSTELSRFYRVFICILLQPFVMNKAYHQYGKKSKVVLDPLLSLERLLLLI